MFWRPSSHRGGLLEKYKVGDAQRLFGCVTRKWSTRKRMPHSNSARDFTAPVLRRCLSFLVGLFLTTPSLLAQDTKPNEVSAEPPKEQQVVEDNVTFSSLTLELTLIRKLIADESFLTVGGCKEEQRDRSLREAKTARQRVLGGGPKNANQGRSVEDYCAPLDEYQVALDTIKDIREHALTESQKQTLSLLKLDIAYRQYLLRKDLGFWGSTQTLQPSIPLVHEQRLRRLLESFEKIADEMEASLDKIDAASLTAAQAQALRDKASNEAKAMALTVDRDQLQRDASLQRADAYGTSFERLEQYRVSLSSRIGSMRTERDATYSALNRAVLNSAASFAGVPAEAVSAIQNGDIKSAVAAVVADAGVQATIQAEVLKAGGVSASLVEGYNQTREIAAQVQDAKESAATAMALLRDPSLDSLSKLGDLAVRSHALPPDAQRALSDVIDKAAPIQAAARLVTRLGSTSPSDLCRTARENSEVRNAIGPEVTSFCDLLDTGVPGLCNTTTPMVARLASLGISGLDSNAHRSIDTGCRVHKSLATFLADQKNVAPLLKGELKGLVEGSLRGSAHETVAYLIGMLDDAEVSRKEISYVIETLLNDSPATLVDAMVAAASGEQKETVRGVLRQALKLPNAASDVSIGRALIDQGIDRFLASNGTTVQFVVEVRGSRPVVLTMDGLAEVFADANHRLALSQQQLQTGLDRLAERSAQVRGVLFRLLPPEALENALVTTGDAKARAWRQLKADLNDADKELVYGSLHKVAVGTMVANEVLAVKPAPAAAPAPRAKPTAPADPIAPPPEESSKDEEMAKAAAVAALNAAFPGAGVAVQVIEGMMVGAALEKELARLEAEERQVVAEMVHLQGMKREALLRTTLMQAEMEISAALQKAADAQVQAYDFAIRQTAAMADKQRTRIRLRRALYFFFAEKLREEFAGLDRSLALWSGVNRTPGRTIEASIRNDPRNARLALDSEIHLFDWLNRDRESTRTDVDLLLMHWRQLIALASDQCSNGNCQPGSPKLGDVQQTKELKLSELAGSSAWQDFREWQRSRRGMPFVASFLLHPGSSGFVLGHLNTRVIDARVGGIDMKGERVHPITVSLTHRGTASVPVIAEGRSDEIVFMKESLLSVTQAGFAWPDEYNTEALKQRWAEAKGARREFEGYGMFTSWQITIQPTEDNYRLQDVVIRFAYSFINPDSVVSEADLFARAANRMLIENDLPVRAFEWQACRKQPGDPSKCAPIGGTALSPVMAAMLVGPDDSESDLSVRLLPRDAEELRRELLRYYAQRESQTSESEQGMDWTARRDAKRQAATRLSQQVDLAMKCAEDLRKGSNSFCVQLRMFPRT